MPPLSVVPRHLFFYGTLVAGNPNPVARAVHAALEPLGRASVTGSLYAIPDPAGWFPALLPGFGTVHGALYRALPAFDAKLLARMDAYEDCDPADPAASLYRRVTARAQPVDGAGLDADLYLWNRAMPDGAIAIAGGDFAGWLAQTGGSVFSATRSA